MSLLRLGWMEHPPAPFTGGAVTVGNFDGVHLGHAELVKSAKRLGSPVIALTFDVPPLAMLYPPAAKPPLTTSAERAEQLHTWADHVVELRTEAGLLALSPEAFFEDVLLGLFRASAIAEGSNFRFGRKREGDVSTLRNLCERHGVLFAEVPQLLDGEAISSSRIRTALLEGDVKSAERWLGRRYSLSGIVETGAKRGRTIGFPTANLGAIATLIPREGVYAGRAKVNGKQYLAAVNVGPAPTFGEQEKKVEVHLLDFSSDIYGSELTLEFAARLREVRAFAGVKELTDQLRIDVERARQCAVQ